jgi:signal transduction histidine kinase
VTGVAESTTPGLTRRVPIVTGFTIALTASVVTISAVAAVLLGVPAGTREIALPVFAFGAIVTFGVGLSDLARAREPGFARALIAAGLLWSLSALAASDQPTLYSLGRVGQWFVDLAIVYVLLSYPSGRLTERIDRTLFAGAALLLGLLYVPTALLAEQFPSPAVWSKCISHCPPNAFAVGHSTPALVQDLLIPLREVLTPAVFIAMAVVLTHRAWRSGPLLRRMYAPIAVIAVTRAVLLAVYFGVRRANPGSEILEVLSWLYVVSLPAAVLACGAGRLYRRLFAASTLDQVAREVRNSTTPLHVRRALAEALRDPSLRILHSFPGDSGAWVDESGAPVTFLPTTTAEQQITEITSGSWRIAMVHDPALAEDQALVRTAGSYALAALENDRLNVELRASLRDLAESRALRIAAEESERRKIERDLHDGAQQRLVTMRLKIGLAAEQLEGHDPHGADVIRALGEDIDATIDEVRAFARGIYPPLLSQTGLREALRAVARGAALATTVHADRLGRYPAEIEATVYFSCSEALQNAAKHARGATGVTIWVWREGQLHFQVRDDGAGFDLQSTPYGTGLSNLHSRLAAVGGTMTVHSSPGEGTVIGGSIPLR